MKLQLYIIKHYGLKYRAKGLQIRFAVIDKDKAIKYPANFLCLLPKQINPKLKQKYKFIELFGSESSQLAFDLLNRALDSEKDTEIREAIRKRLKKLSIKSPLQVKCRLCGNYFEVINRKLEPHRVCRDCRQRIYA
jgi:hypothetical protein